MGPLADESLVPLEVGIGAGGCFDAVVWGGRWWPGDDVGRLPLRGCCRA